MTFFEITFLFIQEYMIRYSTPQRLDSGPDYWKVFPYRD